MNRFMTIVILVFVSLIGLQRFTDAVCDKKCKTIQCFENSSHTTLYRYLKADGSNVTQGHDDVYVDGGNGTKKAEDPPYQIRRYKDCGGSGVCNSKVENEFDSVGCGDCGMDFTNHFKFTCKIKAGGSSVPP